LTALLKQDTRQWDLLDLPGVNAMNKKRGEKYMKRELVKSLELFLRCHRTVYIVVRREKRRRRG
jgi:hypothetical protein